MSHFLNSPIFTGNPQAPTPAGSSNDNTLATTAFVKAQVTGGTVSAVSVATSNGFQGSSSGGATPVITLQTTITGLIKGAGNALVAATAADINGVLLTGFVLGADGSAVAATDSILVGFQKHQVAINARQTIANLSTNTALGTSDTLYPSQNAVKVYVDNAVVGLLDDRGSYDASVNTFPATGGSGNAGAILKGDLWYISVAGTLGGVSVGVGSSIRALSNAPAQVAANWDIMDAGLGFVPAQQNQTMHIGTTPIAINAASGTITTLAGLTSVTSTTFVGSLNGTASKATNVVGGVAGSIHYQTAVDTTAMLAIGTASQVLIGGASAPAWSNTPTLTGTNFTGIPWSALPAAQKPRAIANKTATYTLVAADDIITADATGGAFVISCPASPTLGMSFTIKKIDASVNAVSISGNGKTIDGLASQSLPAQWNALTVTYDGTNWLAS